MSFMLKGMSANIYLIRVNHKSRHITLSIDIQQLFLKFWKYYAACTWHWSVLILTLSNYLIHLIDWKRIELLSKGLSARRGDTYSILQCYGCERHIVLFLAKMYNKIKVTGRFRTSSNFLTGLIILITHESSYSFLKYQSRQIFPNWDRVCSKENILNHVFPSIQ